MIGQTYALKSGLEMSAVERVRVPVDLLLDSSITASAMVVWIALRLYPELTKHGRPSPSQLAILTGLSRPTVRQGLARLAAAGWYQLSPARPVLPPAKPNTRHFIEIPGELLDDRSIRPQAVVMYGLLQATPEYKPPTGKYTRKQLREMTGKALKTISRATNALANRGWIERTRKNHLCPYTFTVKNPVYEQYRKEIRRIMRRIRRPNNVGQGLMGELLSQIVASREYQDNATPGFLVNPYTREMMELDRYYAHARVALEFNGPQHYMETDFAGFEDVVKQQMRDVAKRLICEKRGIRLVVIHPEDLTLKKMIQKVRNLLPLRDLRRSNPIIRYLEKRAWLYRQTARREQALTARRAAVARSQRQEVTAT